VVTNKVHCPIALHVFIAVLPLLLLAAISDERIV